MCHQVKVTGALPEFFGVLDELEPQAEAASTIAAATETAAHLRGMLMWTFI